MGGARLSPCMSIYMSEYLYVCAVPCAAALEQVRDYVASLEAHVADVQAQVSRMVRKEGELAAALAEFGNAGEQLVRAVRVSASPVVECNCWFVMCVCVHWDACNTAVSTLILVLRHACKHASPLILHVNI